jgi:hypothetical protein
MRCPARREVTSAGAAGGCVRTNGSPAATIPATSAAIARACPRRGERDIERLLHDGLYVPRRAQFNRFFDHPNARVRDLARRILAEQRREAERRRLLEEQGADAPIPERDRAEDPGDDDNPF